MDYKDFLEERMIGMYAVIENTECVAMEAFRRKQREEGEAAKRSFLSFLRKKKPEVAEECEKKPNKLIELIKRKTEDYKEWAKEHPKLALVLQLGVVSNGLIVFDKKLLHKQKSEDE